MNRTLIATFAAAGLTFAVHTHGASAESLDLPGLDLEPDSGFTHTFENGFGDAGSGVGLEPRAGGHFLFSSSGRERPGLMAYKTFPPETHRIEPGTYRVSVQLGKGDNRSGFFAGEPAPTLQLRNHADAELPGGEVVDPWANPGPSQWDTFAVEYVVPATSPLIGDPIKVVFQGDGGWSHSLAVDALRVTHAPPRETLGEGDGTAVDSDRGLLEPHAVLIEDFESEQALARWDGEGIRLSIDRGWSTHGDASLRVEYEPGASWPAAETSATLQGSWPNFAAFEHFEADLRNPTDHPAPRPGDSSHGMVFFTSKGPRPGTVPTRFEPNQTRLLRIDIHDTLSEGDKGNAVDVSKIKRFHFYCWNPSHPYVRLIDRVRLTRDLGQDFDDLIGTLDLLQSLGVPEGTADTLRRAISRARQPLESRGFSIAGMAEVRRILADLEQRLVHEATLASAYRPRLETIAQAGSWSDDVRRDLASLRSDLRKAQDRLTAVAGANTYERRAIDRASAEFAVLQAQAADLQAVLTRTRHDGGFAVGWQHPGVFVKPYGKAFTGHFHRPTLHAARGETTGIQLVVFAVEKPLESVRVEIVGTEGLPSDAVSVKAVGFMNLGRATPGSDAYRLNWYPDILHAVPDAGVSVRTMTKQPFLLEVRMPRDEQVASGQVRVRVTADGQTRELPIEIEAYDFEVPASFTLNTVSHGTVADHPMLIEYGMNPSKLYGSYYKMWAEQGRESLIQRQYELGQRMFNVENQQNWHANQDDPWAAERYREFFERMQSLGIPKDVFFFYGFDESPASAYPRIQRHVERLRDAYGVPFMSTPHGPGWTDKPVELFDMWAGGLGKTEAEKRRRIEAIHDAGHEAWWYDNDLGFSPNAWHSRHKGWYAHHWEMDGYLIYHTVAWTNRENRMLNLGSLPYSNWHESSPGAYGASAALTYYERYNGGQRFPSLRLWNFRAGLHDHQYLTMLAGLLRDLHATGVDPDLEPSVQRAAVLLRLDPRLLHPSDWAPLAERRHDIARMIEVFSQGDAP